MNTRLGVIYSILCCAVHFIEAIRGIGASDMRPEP